ncbi:TPA: hypothetical protein DCX16_06375 [bacterium]|nr:hypothetical protein [bacterium]
MKKILFLLWVSLGFSHEIPVDEINSIAIVKDEMYLATMYGIYKSKDRGKNWKNIGPYNTNIVCSNNGFIYAGCEDGLFILRGEKLEHVLNQPFVSAVCFSEKTIVAGTWVGKVLINKDLKKWEEIMCLKSPITKIISLDKYFYLSSYNDGIYKSCDFGHTWEKLGFNGKKVWDILAEKTGLWVATENGLFWGTNTCWITLDKGLTTKKIRRIVRDKDILYLGTSIGGFFISYDNGKSFCSANIGLLNTNIMDIAIDPDDPKNIYIATKNGLYKTEDGGQLWKKLNNGLVYCGKPPPPKNPEDIRKRKAKEGIKSPPKESSHGGH